ncbi:hypothetical protein HYT33_03210 [Candidatus Roizmanbacteria bacterium]|nr:hypothetical protein [Candidatus Roizmanbacteria bacterium]
MTRISRIKLSDQVLNKLFDLFFQIVGKQTNRDVFQNTIIDLLSPVERIMIAKRIAIVYLLMQEIEYVNICNVLKVSPSTVAKFKLLMEKSNGVVPVFKKILRNEKMAKFLLEIFNAIYPPGMPGVNWKAAWERKAALNRKKTYGF